MSAFDEIILKGGGIRYPKLTKKAYDRNPIVYQQVKAKHWLDLLKEGARPTEWEEPNEQGTNVQFELMTTAEDTQLAEMELSEFIQAVNEEYGKVVMTLDKKETTDEPLH